MTKVPKEWVPPCSMQRVIVHWSEGWRVSNPVDREHYHLLIEQTPEGVVRVIRGDHSIADNANTSDGDYAAHTRGCNTGSVGVALCGMVGCQENPFNPGKAPITEAQWNLMLDVVAEVCVSYRIPVNPQTVLCHGEVQKNLGIRQRGKWDPMKWPWDLSVQGKDIGNRLRSAVTTRINSASTGGPIVQAPPVRRTVVLPDGTILTNPNVRVEDGDTWIALRPIADKCGWTIKTTTKTSAVVTIRGVDHTLEMDTEGGTGYVSVHRIAELWGLPVVVSWDSATKTVTLKDKELD